MAKDSTGVDQVGLRGRCVFTGVIHEENVPKGGGTTRTSDNHTGVQVGDFPASLQDKLKALATDRCQFFLWIGDVKVMHIMPGASLTADRVAQLGGTFDHMDIDNGPIPSVQVTHITAGLSANIRFTIDFTIPNCGASNYGNGLINFRFWIHEETDCRTWLTTRTYVGRIRVAHKNISPLQIASFTTIPSLQKGFKRAVVNWNESSDGLHLDFVVQDQEMYAAPPFFLEGGIGAIDWSGQVTASTGKYLGYSGEIDFSLRLTGPKTTPTDALVGIGMNIAGAKARVFEGAAAIFNNAPGFGSIFLDHLSVTEQFAENSIEISAHLHYTDGSNILFGILGKKGYSLPIGRPMGDLGFGYDREKATPWFKTAATNSIFLSMLQKPCRPNTMPFVAGPSDKPPQQPKKQTTPGNDNGSPGDIPGTAQSPNITPSGGQLNNMYLWYNLDSEIHVHSGRIALATGAAKDSKSSPLALVNTHRPFAIREIRIDAARLNDSPTLPDFHADFADGNGIAHSIIGEPQICGIAPQVSADKRKLLFRVSMQAQYALSRVPMVGESLPVGMVPYRVAQLSDPSRSIPGYSFVSPQLILR